MTRVVIFGVVLLALAACAAEPGVAGVAVGRPGTGPSTVPPTSAAPPASPVPSANGPCPYLDNSFIANANGQRVSRVRISADEPHPACFFYRADGKVQLSVRVFVGDAAQAKVLVDEAAPVATSNPAELAAGWTGGAQSTQTGAVLAVAKAGTAVVVTTNQAQTIKAKRVAEQAIAALGL